MQCCLGLAVSAFFAFLALVRVYLHHFWCACLHQGYTVAEINMFSNKRQRTQKEPNDADWRSESQRVALNLQPLPNPKERNPKQPPISKGAVQILRQYFDHTELHYPSAVVKQALAIETVRHFIFACLVSIFPQVASL